MPFKTSAAAGDRGDDRHLVALLHGRLEVLEEADVLAGDEDVDEAAHLAGVVADALADAGVALLQLGEQLADGGAGGGHLLLAGGVLAQRRGNANGGHHFSPWRARISSNALIVGGMLCCDAASAASASCVFRPLPVM